MSVIKFDPDIMQELVQSCNVANEEVQKAQSLLEEIRSHQDWTCREKDAIDDYMSTIKKLINQASEGESSFLSVVTTVKERLTDSENKISKLFENVEDVLRKILAIPVWTNTVRGGGLISGVELNKQWIKEHLEDSTTSVDWLENDENVEVIYKADGTKMYKKVINNTTEGSLVIDYQEIYYDENGNEIGSLMALSEGIESVTEPIAVTDFQQLSNAVDAVS